MKLTNAGRGSLLLWVIVACLAAVVLIAEPAASHVIIISHTTRHGEGSIKVGPCGRLPSRRGRVIHIFEPGETIHLEWNEFVFHPGYFRISFDEDGDDDFVDPSNYNDFYTNASVLVDNLFPHEQPFNVKSYEFDLTLPNVPCENCTIQLIQMMTDKPPYRVGTNDIYYNCLDVALIPARLPEPLLRAGDADQDLDFDQFDLVRVQMTAKYSTGQAATWGEGDWNAAPGGEVGNPPAGDGLFNQFDVIAAQQANVYLGGPYAAVQANGQANDGQTSIVYDANSGEIAVDSPVGTELTSINIDSAAGIFTGNAAENLGGSFDNESDNNVFKATFGGSFGSLSFGNVALAGLSQEFVLADLSVVGSLAGGGGLGSVDLVYVPEPASALLLTIGLVIGLTRTRRANH